MNEDLLSVLSIIGSTMSLVGVGAAIWQVRKTRRAADAARRSAAETHRLMTRNVLLSDLTSSSTSLDGIKSLIRGARFEAALLRVSDLMNHLNQMKALPHSFESEMTFTEILANLHVVRDVLERHLDGKSDAVDSLRIIGFLSGISDELNSWIGQAKFLLPEVKSYDS